jgi:hypothetical protein
LGASVLRKRAKFDRTVLAAAVLQKVGREDGEMGREGGGKGGGGQGK